MDGAYTCLESNPGPVRGTRKPQPHSWMPYAIGRVGFGLYAYMNIQKKSVQVRLRMSGPHHKDFFKSLLKDAKEIGSELKLSLKWEELPGRKHSRISVSRNSVDPTDRGDWLQQHAWIADLLNTLHAEFYPRIRLLDAEQARPSGIFGIL